LPPAPPRPRRKRFRRILLALALCYCLFFLLLITRYTDRLMLYPSTDPRDTTGLTRREIALEGGTKIEIYSMRSAGAADREPQAYVLTFIGNGARAEHTAPFFASDWGTRPVEVWSVNYPGYGKSGGSARLESIGPAALAAYDALREVAKDKPIILQARSIGSTAALHVAANRSVAAVILHNPPALRQLILHHYGWWNLWLVAGPIAWTTPSELDSVANAQRVTVPAAFILAGADEVVPPKNQQLVANAYAGPKRIIRLAGAKHLDRASGQALAEYGAALDWIFQISAGRTSSP
jgi:pimeloyl-ACP methyl ester carboxylesterase